MELYVVRHGQVDANTKNLILGTSDVTLNNVGEQQAKNVREQLLNVNYDFIISSPLIRTRKTAEIINVKGNKIIYDNRLVERDCGILELKCADDFDFLPYCNYNFNKECPGVEKLQDFCSRVWKFLDELEKMYKDKSILLVTHSGVCRAIACYYKGIPEDGNLTFYNHDNCEVKKYDC